MRKQIGEVLADEIKHDVVDKAFNVLGLQLTFSVGTTKLALDHAKKDLDGIPKWAVWREEDGDNAGLDWGDNESWHRQGSTQNQGRDTQRCRGA